jgi:indolepyruvate ferredoxin oxidoreductase beta subunit|tara:strand:+ start:25711 stop:26349 length:639 start_codon:yes stop_codon:yes gene_type:complete
VSEARLAVLIVGVGGQGVLTAGRILGDAAHATGLPVVEGQLHGMSQRGGSVECSVLIGPGESSFLRVADVVVGFEPLEALRAIPKIGPQTRVLLNTGRIVPDELTRAGRPYPPLDSILSDLRAVAGGLHVVDGHAVAKRVGMTRALNIVLLGALEALELLPFGQAALWQAVAGRCRPEFLQANREAFDLGRASVDAPQRRPDGGAVSQERPS